MAARWLDDGVARTGCADGAFGDDAPFTGSIDLLRTEECVVGPRVVAPMTW